MAIHGTTILHKDQDNQPVQGVLRPLTSQTLVTGGATAQTAADFTYKVIRLTATAACWFKLGGTVVTAANTDHYLLPNATEYFAVGGNTRIAAITGGGAGVLYISEMG
jgi:hypothetical protein